MIVKINTYNNSDIVFVHDSSQFECDYHGKRYSAYKYQDLINILKSVKKCAKAGCHEWHRNKLFCSHDCSREYLANQQIQQNHSWRSEYKHQL